MYILGIGDHIHDPSVCLMKDGKILAAIEYERLSRIKHGIEIDQRYYKIETIGAYFSSLKKDLTVSVREGRHLECIQYCLDIVGGIDFNDISMMVVASLFKDRVFRYRSVAIDHHIAHAASAFFPSPFSEAAILTMDGYGNSCEGNSESTMYAVGEGNRINKLDSIVGSADIKQEERAAGIITTTNSVGIFYGNITVLLGMGIFGEGKTMGLAAYGEESNEFNKIDEYIEFLPDGKLAIDNRSIFTYCSSIIEDAKSSLNEKSLFKFYANLAYKYQQLAQQMIIHCSNHLYNIAGKKAICLAGGVALNSVANSKILEHTPFEEIFIQSAAGDNGISIGCAIYGAYMLKGLERKVNKKTYFSPYLGKSYNNEEIQAAANKHEKDIIEEKNVTNPHMLAATLINDGKIVAWFDGRSEFGPRALGNRSILADPRRIEITEFLNQRVKLREHFRPFAPSILEEEASKYFLIETAAPYMILVHSAKEETKEIVPDIVHVDNSVRMQTVTESQNASFYKLIKCFYEITGIPMVLNTSFNRKDEPIVEAPEDAFRCFLAVDMDVLFLNGRAFFKTK